VSEFLVFTVSGIIVAWPPVIVSFIVHHWRIRLYIDKRVNDQTSDIRKMTGAQTGAIRQMTDAQTAELTRRPRWRRRRRA
jgi:hypothetical protein